MIEEILLAVLVAGILYITGVGVLAAISACIWSSRISRQEEECDEDI